VRQVARTGREGKSDKHRFEDVQWLNDVREVRHSLSASRSISVREVQVATGDASPQPTVPFPERHPFCEFNVILEGEITQFVGAEKVERRPGDVMLLGTGVPHYALRHSHQHRTFTIYFLPLVLFEMGPGGDGAWFISRFAAAQRIDQRVVRPPVKLRARLLAQIEVVGREFRAGQLGSELHLWDLLIETLVDLLRWEHANGRGAVKGSPSQDWLVLQKALRYAHEHYTEQIYIDWVAEAVGVTVNRLRELFRTTLGMSCSQYIQSLRIAEATSRLCQPDAQVTTIALDAGFETVSHFNTSFRKQTGMSPTQYMRNIAH
jgi:AraC-like DNA-binding protein/quercetin dioxygenase-like cupin family protein